jgi:hypothetical protein
MEVGNQSCIENIIDAIMESYLGISDLALGMIMLPIKKNIPV